MQLKECYQIFGGDYEDAKKRLYTDELILRLVLKFLSDPNYDRLGCALERGDYEDAFEAVHTLKGVSQNLGFQRLTHSASGLTELLRGKKEEEIDKEQCDRLWQEIGRDYDEIIQTVKMLQTES